MSLKPIKVHSYSGYKAEERPISFFFEGNEWQVEKILASWKQESINPREGRRIYFEIKAEGDQIFTIFYNEKDDQWFVLS
jgi:hypothetical protein